MQNKDTIYSELSFIKEEQDPCLRYLRKKIRNNIKKIEQIKELEKKDFLQPEQIEKVNRKHKFTQQRDKYVEFVTIYRQILIQNRQLFERKAQDPLRLIANAFTFLNRQQKTQEKQFNDLTKMSQLLNPQDRNEDWKVQSDRNYTILKSVATNDKINKKIQEQLNKKQLIAKKQKRIKSTGDISWKKEQISIDRDKINSMEKTQEKTIQKTIQEERTIKTQIKEEEEKKDKIDVQTQRRQRRPRKSKKQDKSEEYPEQNQGINQFRKEQKKKLQDQGFIFVGKAKPKAKDQKKWHEHQHGHKSNPFRRERKPR